MLVVLPYEGSSFRKTWEILNKIKPKFAIDLLVKTPVKIEQRLAWNDFFMREIIEKGKVIYESANKGYSASSIKFLQINPARSEVNFRFNSIKIGLYL